MIQPVVDLWLRRWWRASPDAQAYIGLRPMTIVTGGSQGIGRALALEFAALGNPILLVARRAEPLGEAARAIAEAAKIEVLVVAADLSTPAGITAIDVALAAHKGYCDVLVNNAAMGLAGPFHRA